MDIHQRIHVGWLCLSLSVTSGAFAQKQVGPAGEFPRYEAIEAGQTRQSFRLKNGFTLDLLAAEPLISSPVAVAYEENGVAYVVEMRDYPYTDKSTHEAWKENTTDRPIGRIRQLIDRDGDGVFDESHIFADGLSWPTGVAVWKGGIYVTATPDVWYLKDADGDHRAEVREKVFTGFRKYNVQAVINTPLWGLDNRITFAGGTNGGQVRSLQHPEIAPLRVARNDLRIDPRQGTIEAIAGGARFGHTMDDWGNRFLCNIRNPAQHVVFDGTVSGRNPLLPVPNPVYDARVPGDTLPVKRISPLEPWRDLRAQRWTTEGQKIPRSELIGGGVFTSAAGITIYRGAAYPENYRGQAFVAEVANNLVQRQNVVKDGVTFKIDPADDDVEFLASTDIWFRPVNFVNAPDGTLHVVDMYRETIEHPWSIPDDIREMLDLESGRDRGRLYRLSPPGFKAPAAPRLGNASIAELVATLENPNAWWRETAQRLLIEREDQTSVAPLKALLRNSAQPLARVHALWTLEGLGALNAEDLQGAFKDEHAGVREHAVQISVHHFSSSASLIGSVAALAKDPEIRVRYQVAYATGAMAGSEGADAAVAILQRDAADQWVRAAALSGTPERCAQIAQAWLKNSTAAASASSLEVVKLFAFVAGAENKRMTLDALYVALSKSAGRAQFEDVFWASLSDGLRQARTNLRAAFPDTKSPAGRAATEALGKASRVARDSSRPVAERLQAIRLLGHEAWSVASPVLAGLLTSGSDPLIQSAAVKTLSTFSEKSVGETLLVPWDSFTPTVRAEVISALLTRAEWIGTLLSSFDQGKMGMGSLTAMQRSQLLGHANSGVKARAERLLGDGVSGSRVEVMAAFRPSLALKGDATRGGTQYEQRCAACHRFAGRGIDLGPNLETIRGWDKEKILLNLIDPNREVAANYLAYTVELKDGRSFTGMIVEETPGGIKLRRVGESEEVILRQNISKLTGMSRSLMPEGLEAGLSAQEMADLLSFLSGTP